MKVCLLAPYGRNEVTAAAIRVADLSLAQGNDTRLLSVGVHENNIDAHWDHQVVGRRRQAVYRACSGASVCVWFVDNPSLRKMVELVAPRARHILVVQSRASTLTQATLAHYGTLVCPSKAASEALRINVLAGVSPVPLTWTRFDSGMPSVSRHGSSATDIAMIVLADHSAIDECGMQLLLVLSDILDSFSDLRITVYSSKTWNRPARRYMARSQQTHADRLSFAYQRSWLGQAELIHCHDLAFIPATRADFGINVSRCLSCSVPVVAFDVAPFNELLVDGKSGWLIPTDITEGSCTQVAVPSTVAMVATLATALAEGAVDRSRNHNWHLGDRRSAFEKAWIDILG